jgi:5-methylthioadenosine/S-adenosylhomocysteine deaminase
MMLDGAIDRRRFLEGSAAAGALGALAAPAAAAVRETPTRGRVGRARAGLPGRGEFTIRGAHLLTMDPDLGDIPGGDVHVRNGRIAAVGRHLPRRGRELDGRRTIVMPGLIDTHWHMWTALHRSLASSSPQNAYFALNLRLGAACRPVDIYNGVRLALAEAVSAGITTVHDWAHNIRGPAFADANLRAHARGGLRGRFSYGTPQGHPPTQTLDLADLERVRSQWFDAGRVPLLRLGLAGRPPGLVGPDVYRPEFETAQRLGLPVSYHVNSTRPQGAQQMIKLLAGEGMLGPDTQLIHALYTSAEERGLAASSRSPVSVSPWSELLIGYGVSPIRELLDSGVLLNLSVDTLPLTGNADMFSIMKVVLGLYRGQAEQELSLGARRVLELATIDAARGLGLEELTGSLAPGKRADLIMIRTDEVNIAPFTDAANMVALAAQPGNVDTVVVDGRILKRHGRLTAVDVHDVIRRASASLAAVRQRAGDPAAAATAIGAAHPAICC